MRLDDLFPALHLTAVEAVDRAVDRESGELIGVLGDGGQGDRGQPGQSAVVVSDDADVAGDGYSALTQDLEHAQRAAGPLKTVIAVGRVGAASNSRVARAPSSSPRPPLMICAGPVIP